MGSEYHVAALALSAAALAVLFGAAWVGLRKTTCVRMRMMVLGVIVAVMASFMPAEFAWTKRTSISDSTVTTKSALSRVGFLLVLGGVFATVAQKREETETADA